MFSLIAAFAVAQTTCPQCPPRVVYSVPTYARQTTYAALEPVAAINAARGQYGLAAMARDGNLNAVAAVRARECAAANSYSHNSPSGANYGLGECTYWGSGSLRGGCVAWWLGSPPHRATLLGGSRRVGVASAEGAGGVLFTVAVFGQ